jgi:hypothetical protein
MRTRDFPGYSPGRFRGPPGSELSPETSPRRPLRSKIESDQMLRVAERGLSYRAKKPRRNEHFFLLHEWVTPKVTPRLLSDGVSRSPRHHRRSLGIPNFMCNQFWICMMVGPSI